MQRSAKAIKRNGGEPTFQRILSSCPEAVKNPATNKAVGKKRVYEIFENECYDDGAEQPWKHRRRLTKSALPEEVMEKRMGWQKYMVGLNHTDEWYYKNLIWIDLCNSILPTSEKKAAEQALARKGGSGWMSPGCQEYNCFVFCFREPTANTTNKKQKQQKQTSRSTAETSGAKRNASSRTQLTL